MGKCPLIIVATLVGWVLSASSAMAHPHVWITSTTKFIVEAGQIVAVENNWAFDDFYSSSLITDFDLNGDGAFSPDEVAEIRTGAFENLKEYNYFTQVRVGADKLTLSSVQSFTASQYDGIVTYAFRVALPRPLDPKAEPLLIGVFDASFYVDISPPEKTPLSSYARLEGDAPGCQVEEFNDVDNPIPDWGVIPIYYRFSCPRS